MGALELDPVMKELASLPPQDLHRLTRTDTEQEKTYCAVRCKYCMPSSIQPIPSLHIQTKQMIRILVTVTQLPPSGNKQ